jgi:hypothetical protein
MHLFIEEVKLFVKSKSPCGRGVRERERDINGWV